MAPGIEKMAGVTFGLERRNEKRRDEKNAAAVITDWIEDMRAYMELPEVQRYLRARDEAYDGEMD